ncbi:STAS domain-containing protein [Nannocystis pusilla]|uniref:PAS domain S-box protein n=1 Tax=Nannocystis pusilla TaxID=889268 RepID=A0ABS7TQK8_9BACT|nr:PAS domain S-box protein [Nannocystis pusilla]
MAAAREAIADAWRIERGRGADEVVDSPRVTGSRTSVRQRNLAGSQSIALRDGSTPGRLGRPEACTRLVPALTILSSSQFERRSDRVVVMNGASDEGAEERERLNALSRRVAELEEQVAARDRTIELLRARDSLEEERQQMLAAVENCADFIGICSLDGRAIYCNPAGRRLIGYDLDADMRGFDVSQALTPEATRYFLQHIVPAIQATGRWEGELEFRHLVTGESFPTQYNAFMVKDQQTGQPLGIGAVTRDLRAARRAEEERRQLQDEVIRTQAAMLADLSTPLIPISDDVVVMPLIGTVDENRANQVLESLLAGVSARGAKVAILDITGVAAVDAAVAEGLLRAARAVRLLGAEVVLTGIRAEVAQALVGLGVDLGNIVTRGTLQSGIAFAMRRA